MDKKSGIKGTGGTPKQEPTKAGQPLARSLSQGATTTRKSVKTEPETKQPTVTARTLEEKGKTALATFQSLIAQMKDLALSETTDKGGKGTVFENKPAQFKKNANKAFEQFIKEHENNLISEHEYNLISVENCKQFIDEIHKMKGVDAEFKLVLLKAFTDKLRHPFTLSKNLNDYIHNISKNLNLTIFQSFITQMKDYGEMTGPGGIGTNAKNNQEQFQKDINEAFNTFVNEHDLTVADVRNFTDEIRKMKGTSPEFKLALLNVLIKNERTKKHEVLTNDIKVISRNLRLTDFQSIVEQFKVAENQQQAQESFDALIGNYFVTSAEIENFANEIKKMKGASTKLKLALLDILVSNERIKNAKTLVAYIKEISEELKGYKLKPMRQEVLKNIGYIDDLKTKLTKTTSRYSSGENLPKSITNLLGSHQNIQGATFNNLNKATRLLTEIENHLKQSATEPDSNEAMAVDFLSSVLNADSSNPFLKVGEAFQYYQQLTEELAKSHTTTFDKTTFVEQMQKIDTAYNAVFPKLEELVKNMPDSKKKEELIKLLNESKKQKTYFDEAVKLIKEADIQKILEELKTEQGKELDSTESIVKKVFTIAGIALAVTLTGALLAGLLMSGIGAIIVIVCFAILGLGTSTTFGVAGFGKISAHERQVDAAQEAFEELSKLLQTGSKKTTPLLPPETPQISAATPISETSTAIDTPRKQPKPYPPYDEL